MSRPLLFINIVIEFPENTYVLCSTKFPNSKYEFALLTSCHKVTAANLFRWFRNMHSSCNTENVQEIVSKMVETFEIFKDKLFPSLREYILVEGIVQISYDLQLQDSNLICQILNLLYGCWTSFGPFHFKAILGRQSRRRYRSHPDMLTFFLEHARRNKLVYAGFRMIDVSIYSCFLKSAVLLAADVWNWKKMLTYLQYGARWENGAHDSISPHYRAPSALIETIRTLIRHLWFRLVYPSLHSCNRDRDIIVYCMNLDVEVKNLCQTLNVLLRAVRQIPSRSLEYIIKDCDSRNKIMLVPSRDVMTHRTVEIMIPKLLKRYEYPEELQHICRWTIREQLNENWQLPHGISNLPLPKRLQRYLNLQID